MFGSSAPTSQKSDVRPITFVADYASGAVIRSFTLPIRPEDLSINRPMRSTVHQTLDKQTQGWVDEFGPGLPTITISGHTGWRAQSSGMDGLQAFEELSWFINERYPKVRQIAIDYGRDPEVAKLILVDLLDGFAWEVAPIQFVMRRSKSRPLLVQYNMTLQVVNTQVDGGLQKYMPQAGNLAGGLGALGGVIGKIMGLVDKIKGALAFVKSIAAKVMGFVNTAIKVLKAVQSVVASVKGFINGIAGQVIGIAKGISAVGREVFRTFAAIQSIPGTVKQAFSQMAAAFNEAVCIFSNSLKPKKTYEQFDGVYGASNCSSTTGGRQPSPFSNQNVFAVINQKDAVPVTLSGAAISSANTILSTDAPRAPLPTPEIGRHLDNISSGTVVTT